MTKFAFTRSDIEKLNPCGEFAMFSAKRILDDDWATNPINAKTALEKGINFYDLLWVVEQYFNKDKKFNCRLHIA